MEGFWLESGGGSVVRGRGEEVVSGGVVSRLAENGVIEIGRAHV